MQDFVTNISTECVPTKEMGVPMLSKTICHQGITSPCSELPPAFRNHPTKLFVETTTRCNLKCQSCVKCNELQTSDTKTANIAIS